MARSDELKAAEAEEAAEAAPAAVDVSKATPAEIADKVLADTQLLSDTADALVGHGDPGNQAAGAQLSVLVTAIRDLAQAHKNS